MSSTDWRRSAGWRYVLAVPLIILTALAIAGPLTPDIFIGDGSEASAPEAQAADQCYSFIISYTDGTQDIAGFNGIPQVCGNNDLTRAEYLAATGLQMHAVELHLSCSDDGLTDPNEPVTKSDLGGKTVDAANSFIQGKKTCGTPFVPGDPDVVVSKIANTSSVNAGGTILYTIEASNVGSQAADDVVVTDDLDDDLTNVSIAAGPCTVGAGNAITCNLGTLDVNEKVTMVISVVAPVAACPEVQNVSSIAASNEPSANQGNNSSQTVTVAVICDQDPDVVVSKTASTAGVTAGDSYTYTLTAENVGLGSASNVVVTDNVDDDLVVNSASWNAGANNCTVGANNAISCALGTLASGASVDITIAVTTTPAACPEVVNQSSIRASNEPTANQGNNDSQQVTVDVTCQDPDVVVSKTASAEGVTAGDDFTYTITAQNVGETDAENVVVTDNLDDDLVVNSATWASLTVARGGTCDVGTNNAIMCELGTLVAGESVEITIEVTTTAANCPEVLNQAHISATNEPTDASNDNDSEEVSVDVDCSFPNVVVEKSASDDGVAAGDTFTYTMVVTNIGTVAAEDVVLSDALDQSLDVLSAVADQGTCMLGVNNDLTCELGTIGGGDSVVIEIAVATSRGSCPEVINQSHVEASNEPAEAQDDNDSDEVTVMVTCPEGPDVVVTKTSSSASVTAGDGYTYTLVARNVGDVDAEDVVVRDNLDNALDVSSASASPTGTCTVGTNNAVMCDLGTLAAGESVTITIVVTATTEACPEVFNRATVDSSNEPEANRGNNLSDEVEVDIECPPPPGTPDVLVTKSTLVTVVQPGETFDYLITASNVGDVAAEDVVVSDDLADEFFVESATWADGTCGIAAVSGANPDGSVDQNLNLIDCALGTLAAGESVDITITVTVPEGNEAELCGRVFPNVSTVFASNEPAGNQANNESDEVEVRTEDCDVLPGCEGNLVVRVFDARTGELVGGATVVLDDFRTSESISGTYVPETGQETFPDLVCRRVDGEITQTPPGYDTILEPSSKTVTIVDQQTSFMDFFVTFTVLPDPPRDREPPLPRTGTDPVTGLWLGIAAIAAGSTFLRRSRRDSRPERL